MKQNAKDAVAQCASCKKYFTLWVEGEDDICDVCAGDTSEFYDTDPALIDVTVGEE